MNAAERTVRALDRMQQRRTAPGFVVGVVRKYGDDRGGLLAALITYYAFTAVFPLLLLLTTILGYVLHDSPGAQHAVLNSALADFPIIGSQLSQNVSSLQGSGLALVVGLVGLLYGSLGVTQVLQFAMAQVWAVPGVRRPGFLPRLGRGLLLLGVLGLGLVLSAAGAAVVGGVAGGGIGRVLGLLGSAVLNIGLFLVSFRILTPAQADTRSLLPGCLLAGPAWTALQAFGGYLVTHELRHATAVFGFFGTVLGLLWWLYLSAQVTVYAAEVNVVRARRLWPRSLLQPPLTAADQQVLDAIAEQEERRPEQRVSSRFPRRARRRPK
ncbi:YihY/virulence factor BrkB family protein [Kitasatospora sp. McL0602]|uniref:YihY/virulence factor BrkB family protein n=1 Tax=Kitasatospora sp. McL0602 TaxID=3439530 RepID=UPI003F8AD0B0